MSISESRYRLGEFMITEHGGLLLTWTAHIALGNQRSGECFIVGDILVIGSSASEEAGFLKLEFHEHLMKLPAWNRTRYYCFASSLREAGGEHGPLGNLLKRLSAAAINAGATDVGGPGAFRLGRYEIAVGEGSAISWKTVGESNREAGGKCFAESGVLFLGPREYESDVGQSKQEFFSHLKVLSQWDRTIAWGDHGSLLPCEGQSSGKPRAALWRPEQMKAFIKSSTAFTKMREPRKEYIAEMKASASGRLTGAWRHAGQWKIWESAKSFAVRGGLFVFRVFVSAVLEILDLSGRIIDRFRGYKRR